MGIAGKPEPRLMAAPDLDCETDQERAGAEDKRDHVVDWLASTQ
jgi:hypothetical protein